jgi:hypothetical protein
MPDRLRQKVYFICVSTTARPVMCRYAPRARCPSAGAFCRSPSLF